MNNKQIIFYLNNNEKIEINNIMSIQYFDYSFSKHHSTSIRSTDINLKKVYDNKDLINIIKFKNCEDMISISLSPIEKIESYCVYYKKNEDTEEESIIYSIELDLK